MSACSKGRYSAGGSCRGRIVSSDDCSGCDGGGACARETEQTTKARVKKNIGRLRLVVMFITIITEGGLDFDAVTVRLWNVLVLAHGMNRLTVGRVKK